MLELTEVDAVLEHVNLRTQKSGPEDKPAADLKFAISMSNDVLNLIEPGLREALYAASRGAKDDLVTPGHLPSLRFHALDELPFKTSLVGAKVLLKRGITGQSDIDLGTCEVNKVRVQAQDGGTISMRVRVQAFPSAEQIGQLYELQHATLALSITPPTADAMAEAIRQRQQAKAKTASADDQTQPLLPAGPLPGAKKTKPGRRHAEPSEPKLVVAPESWPFPIGDPDKPNDVDRSGALKALAAAGYKIPEEEIGRWSDDDAKAAVDYCSQLENIRGKTQPPSPPTVLKGRVRSRPRAGMH